MNDYKERKYLSSIEVAKYLGITVQALHGLVRQKKIESVISTSGQKRFKLKDLKSYEKKQIKEEKISQKQIKKQNLLKINDTSHKIYIKNSMSMDELEDNSIHLMVTSPPYFNAKMYMKKSIKGDLGNIHDLSEWFEKIGLVWKEVFRVLMEEKLL